MIGYLRSETAECYSRRRTAFSVGLKEAGHAAGRNVGIGFRWAEGQYHRQPQLAKELAKELAKQLRHLPWVDKFKALAAATPLIAVIVVSIGGIYLGIFTPVEASGVGALLITVMAFFSRQIALPQFVVALVESARTTAMIFFIVIGASVFAPFLSLTHLPTTVGEALAATELGRYGTLIAILALYIVLGTFLETFSMLVISIPIFFPIILKLGFDPIWFGVLVVVVVEMGLITPPVGLNVYVVKGLAPEVPMIDIFSGISTFFIAMLVGLAILIAFPAISLWLPNSMFN